MSRDATPSGFPTSEIGTYMFGRLFPRLATASSVYSFAAVSAAAADPAGSNKLSIASFFHKPVVASYLNT